MYPLLVHEECVFLVRLASKNSGSVPGRESTLLVILASLGTGSGICCYSWSRLLFHSDGNPNSR